VKDKEGRMNVMVDMAVEAHGIMDGATYVFRKIQLVVAESKDVL